MLRPTSTSGHANNTVVDCICVELFSVYARSCFSVSVSQVVDCNANLHRCAVTFTHFFAVQLMQIF